MEWTYNNQPVTDDQIQGYAGFVYLITNTQTQRKYIGKKLFSFSRKKKVKGKNKRVSVDSQWRLYYGSNDKLNEDVAVLGEQYFTREILRLCKLKSEMSYYEAKLQFEHDAIIRDDYYNGWISCRIRGDQLKKVIDGNYVS